MQYIIDTARLDAIPDRIVLGTDADGYGVDVSALENDGYFIRALGGEGVVLDFVEGGDARGVDGVEVEDVDGVLSGDGGGGALVGVEREGEGDGGEGREVGDGGGEGRDALGGLDGVAGGGVDGFDLVVYLPQLVVVEVHLVEEDTGGDVVGFGSD